MYCVSVCVCVCVYVNVCVCVYIFQGMFMMIDERMMYDDLSTSFNIIFSIWNPY